MKASQFFAVLSLFSASLPAFGMSELEALRSRCDDQQRQIAKLEEQLRSLNTTPALADSNDRSKQAAQSNSASYTVQKGDSLERIANRFKTTPETIARINRLKLSSVIHPGQKLKVPGSTSHPKTIAERPAITSESYQIQEGDTYSSISRKTGISVNRLVAANPKVKATAMRPGQIIHLPRKAASSPATNAPAPRDTPASLAKADEPKPLATQPASAGNADATVPMTETISHSPAPAETTPSPSHAERKIRPVMIDGEMTYGDFASQHGTDIVRLNDLNGLDLTGATVLARGSELYVPAQP